MQKIKKPLSIILALLMLMTMIPFSSLTVSAADQSSYVSAGAFKVWGGVAGTDFSFSSGALVILTSKKLVIQNQDPDTPTSHRIVIRGYVSANIELSGVNIDTSAIKMPALIISESTSDVTITLGTEYPNYLKSGYGCAGIQKNARVYNTQTGTLTIQGDGSLTAIGGYGAAGIGGGVGQNTCNINILGGKINAIASTKDENENLPIMGGAGIGGGSSHIETSSAEDLGGSAENIKISGGIINAYGGLLANAIGVGCISSQNVGYCKNISITGAYVTLNAGPMQECMGSVGVENTNLSISNSIVWFVKENLYYPMTEISFSNCIMYDNGEGKVYDNYTLPDNHTILPNHTLTIPSSSTLTVPAGITLTNQGTIVKEGNLVLNGDLVCDKHNFVNRVCTRCFKPCTHIQYSNGFCADCGKRTEELTVNSNGYYEISNAGELLLFAEKTQSDKSLNAILTANINVNNGTITANSTGVRNWTPITIDYAGTFDGNGYSISGLYYNSSDNFNGFIGSLANTGTVKNLTIKNSYINGGSYIAGIAGSNEGTIENCHVSATVNGTEYIAGIAGNNIGTIENCHVSATVNGTENIGGISGISYGTITNCSSAGKVTGTGAYVGGIVGFHSGTVMENCHNSATVLGDSSVGGITGCTTVEITKCSNSGKITATIDMVAGIVGEAVSDNGAGVSYCSNTGEVVGNDNIGGIVGFGYDTPITNCYSTGTIAFNEISSNDKIGTIFGFNSSFNHAVNCYYLDTTETDGYYDIDYKGHTESATIDQFKSGEIAYRLNSTDEIVWYQTIGTDEIPQFKGDKVYYGYLSCSDSAKKQYTNTSTASDTKPNHTEGTPANCKDLAVCKICSETYGSINSKNHKSDETYSEYFDDKYHKNYHSCCNALIGTSYHSKGTEANCTTKNYCSDCKEYYGSTNAKNHTGEFIWIDNGDGTHIKKWPCCNFIENETKAHSYTYTADDEKNVITAHCKDCEYESSISLVAPTGDLIYDGTWQDSTVEGEIHGVEWDLENYKNGERFTEALRDAGKYKQVLTIGGKSVSVEYEIKKRELKVENVHVDYKEFDGTRKIKVYSVYFDGLIGSDNVIANCDNAYTYAPSCRVGDYEKVSGLTGVIVEGDDMENYIIPEISEDVEYSAYYSIHPYDITITPKDQYITEASKLDKTAFTVDTELPEGYTLEGMAVALEGTATIIVDTTNAKVMYGDEDFTDCFYFNTYNTAIAIICCENHQADENGFCSTGKCFAFESPKLNNNGTPDDGYDDYYEIANAGQLYWYAQLVNVYGINDAHAKLVADINIPLTASQGGNVPDWTPINYLYADFDGQGHFISGLYVDSNADYVGFYGYSGYYPLKNLIIKDSYFKGSYAVGAMAGYNQGEIINCAVTDTVTVVGDSSYVGAFVGDNSSSIANSYAMADSFAGYSGGYISNCYYIGTEETDDCDDTTALSAEAFANGEVAYLLQAGIPEEDIYDDDWNYIETITPHVWGQKLGVDEYPVVGGDKVYYGYKDCHATKMTYCNNKAYDEIPTHNYEKGKCTICGDKDPDAKLVSITGDITLALEEADKDIFTGVIELEAGTYSFNLVDDGIIRGKNFTYSNTASIDYSAGYTAPTKLKATGGKYTFTYNALTLVLKIDYEPVELIGDVNGDGNISVSDVIFVMKHIVGDITLDDKQAFRADIDSNGKITLVDALKIQKMILEMA